MHHVPAENFFAEKGPYKHFMAKEMHEQPQVVADALARYLAPDRSRVLHEEIDFSGCSRIVLVACGTAHYACHVAKYWFESLARLPVEIEVASEFRYREPPLGPGTLGLFVSQSGETADTLAALRYVKAQGGRIVSVVNVETSTIARESDVVLPILAGPEIGVASTKAFTCQLTVLATLAIAAARACGRLDPAEEARLVATLGTAPGLLARALALEPEIAEIARDLARARDVLFLGRGAMYPLALEGALKLKEISYIHAEGYASGELKHGPIALIDEEVPVIVLAPSDALFDKTVSNMQEVMARDGRVLLVSDAEGMTHAGSGAWHRLTMPAVDPFVEPDRLCRAGAAARLPHGGAQGHRRRPAAQPREVGDGRVGRRAGRVRDGEIRATASIALAGAVDQPDADPPHGRADPVGHPELQADAAHVRVDGMGRDAEDVADQRVALAARHPAEHLDLPLRQPRRRTERRDQEGAVAHVRELAHPLELVSTAGRSRRTPGTNPRPHCPSRPFGP